MERFPGTRGQGRHNIVEQGEFEAYEPECWERDADCEKGEWNKSDGVGDGEYIGQTGSPSRIVRLSTKVTAVKHGACAALSGVYILIAYQFGCILELASSEL